METGVGASGVVCAAPETVMQAGLLRKNQTQAAQCLVTTLGLHGHCRL